MPGAPAARLGATVAGAAFATLALACGGAGPRRVELGSASSAPTAGLRTPGMGAPDDPTVLGARLLPASFEEARAWGTEPGGGVRAVVEGLRVVVRATGQIEAARDRLPSNPGLVTELPERLGGGFLFTMGGRPPARLWRAASWLAPAAPIWSSAAPLADVLVGLDRVYVRVAQGPLLALDPRTGASLDLGPLPASPRVASIAALDAWRAVAVADLRGTMMTLDAGSSWRPVALPVEPLRAVPAGGPEEGIAVSGVDARRTLQWWQVLPDGTTSRLGAAPSANDAARPLPEGGEPPLGPHPLLAAVEDGWPLRDGSALVARDGFLVRVRLADGAVVERVEGAFPRKPARCHPISLGREGDRGAFGFACGAPHEGTSIYAWDANASRLAELGAFDAPREVLAAGNGALAVRGPCDRGSRLATASASAAQAWCLMAPGLGWREVRFTGERVDRARVVALADGRVALVRPPAGGDLSTARLTITAADGAHARDLAIRVPPVAPEVARALRTGVWRDGFEERRPGVLGGWVDGAGPLLGVEITLEGELRPGEYIRDAGALVASGRWALGWTDSGGGFETTDGGMSWQKEIELPDPIAEPRAGRGRSCGPIGCVTSGWVRLGWGAVEPLPPAEPPPARPLPVHKSPGLLLDCARMRPPPVEALAPPPPGSPAPYVASSAPGRRGDPSGPTVSQFGLFGGRNGPALAPGEMGASVGASMPFERSLAFRFVARAYAWGPGNREWDPPGHWMVRWLWPWWGPGDGAPVPRSSSIAPAPWSSLAAAARAMGSPVGTLPEWTLVPGDDPDHALLAEKRAALGSAVQGSPGEIALEVLETDRPPADVRRPNGGLLPDLQGAVRSGGRWYVATAQVPGEPASTVLWVLDGNVAREVGRVPRVAPEAAGPARVLRWVGGGVGSAVALAVAGQDPERGTPLWVSRFDPDAHGFADPELLDVTDRPIGACSDADAGWELLGPFPGTVDMRVRDAWSGRLRATMARLRLSRAGACVDRVFASADLPGNATGTGTGTEPGPSGPAAAGGAVAVTLVAAAPTAITADPERERFQCRMVSP